MPRDERSVRLAEVVGALSLATDLGMGQAFHQGLRSNVLAVRLAWLLGFDDEQLLEAYYLPTLRFNGCTADSGALNKFFGDELKADTRLIPLQSASHGAMVRFSVGARSRRAPSSAPGPACGRSGVRAVGRQGRSGHGEG